MAGKGTSSTPEIKINFSYEAKSSAKGKLKTRLEEIEKVAKPLVLNIDFKAKGESMKNLNSSLTKIKTKLGALTLDTFNKNLEEALANATKLSIELDKANKSPYARRVMAKDTYDTKAIKQAEKETLASIAKQEKAYKDMVNKSKKELKTLAEEQQRSAKQAIEATDKLAEAQKRANGREIKKQNRLDLDIDGFQRTVALLRQTGSVSSEVIDKMEAKFNSFTTKTPRNEVILFGRDLANLARDDKGITPLTKRFDALKLKISELRKQAIEINNTKAIQQLDKIEKEMLDVTTQSDKMGKGLAVNTNVANGTMNKLESSTKQVAKSMQVTTREASTFGGTLRDFGQLFGMYSLAYTGVRMLTSGVREGFGAVKELDKAMTTLSITMDGLSDSKLKTFGSNLQDLSRDLSTTTSRVLETAQVFANSSETLDSIKNKTSSAVILGNISGAGVEESVNAIQGATQQFKDLGDGTTESAMKVTDSMTAISKSLAIDFGAGVRGFIDGVSVMGGVSDQLGMNIDDTLGMLGTGMEKLRLTGSEVATSLRNIAIRTNRIKGLGVEESDLADAEKALKNYGIEIRKTDGSIQPFMETMEQLSTTWDTLSEQEQFNLGEAMGGVKQLNNVLAIVKNFERVNELVDIGNNSFGQGEIAQDKWAEGLEGRLAGLTGKIQIFWQTFIGSDFVGGIVSGLGGIVDSLTWLTDKLGSATVGATALSMIFLSFGKNNMFKGMVNEWSASLAKYIATSMNATKVVKALEVAERSRGIATQGSTVATQAGAVGMSVFSGSTMVATASVVALQIALTMGLSVIIGAVIGGLTKLVGWMKDLGGATNMTTEELSEFNSEIRGQIDDLKKTTSSTDELLGKMKELQGVLESDAGFKEKEEAVRRLKEAQMELAQLNPEMVEGYDKEGNAIITNVELLEKYNDLKKQELQDKAEEWFATNKNTLATLEDIEAKKRQLKIMEEAKKQGKNYTLEDSTITETRYTGQTITKDVQVQKQFSDKDMKKLKEEVNSAVGVTADLTRNFSLLSDEQKEASGYTEERIASIIDGLTDGSTSAEEMAEAVNGVDNAVKNTDDSVKSLTDSMDGANTLAETLKTAMEEYAELGALTYETQKKLMSNEDPRATALLADKNTFMEKANALYGEQIALRDTERDKIIDLTMLEMDKQKIVEMGANNQLGLIGQILNANSNSYADDMINFQQYLNGKAKLNNITIDALAIWLQNLVGGNIDGYKDDLKNSENWATAKAKILAKLNEQITKVKNEMNITEKLGTARSLTGELDPVAKMRLESQQRELDNLYKSTTEIITDFSGMGTSFTNSMGTVLDKVGTDKVGTGEKPDKDKDKKEKEEARYKVSLEQWYRLNDAIEDNNNALDRNRAKQENATGKEKIDLMSQEIALLEKQVSLNKQLQGEMEKSRNELKQYIASRGGQFDGENLTNYESLLGREAVGDSDIEALKALEDAVKSYTDLCNNSIPGVVSEWEKLSNEIKSIKESQLEMVIDFEQNMYSAIEHYAKKENELRKKDIEEEKKAINEKKKLLEERRVINAPYV